MSKHSLRPVIAFLLAAVVAVGSACSNGDGGSTSAEGTDDGAGQTTTIPEPVEAVLLPAEGPVQAGVYALPGFVDLPTIELGAGWTVIIRGEGSTTLAYEFDPEGTELNRLNVAQVSGVFDVPIVAPDDMRSPALQQGHVRPVPATGLAAFLATLPGVTVSDPTDVAIGGEEGERFTAEVGDLPAEAKQKCPQIPTGCVAAYDVPGATAAVFPGGTSHDLTTLEHEGQTYLAAVAEPSTGAPEGFEEAARAAIESLSFDRPVVLDEAATMALFVDGVVDNGVRPMARSVTAPGSPASVFMAALDHDRTAQVLAGHDLPVGSVAQAGDRKVTVTAGGSGQTPVEYADFTYEGGRVATFTVDGKPIGDYVRAVEEAEAVTLGGGLQVTVLETYRSFVSGRLWVPVRARSGTSPVDLTSLTITHVAPDGTRREESTGKTTLPVPPHWDAPSTLVFDGAPFGGQIVFGGTIGGQVVDVTIELPN